MTLSAGTHLGPYEILSTLGAGGMGEVYRAHDSRLDRHVAIKVLPEALANDSHALARFETEAKAVAALSHPNILAIHDFGRDGGVTYAVTELLEGESLRAVLLRGALDLRRALALVEQVAKALAAAHEKGIVHRDVKPENVFVSKDGDAKLLDFGLARQTSVFSDPGDTHSPTGAILTEEGAVIGTVYYMSPEQASGRPVDYRSDQFSLGIVLYEMLAGRRPFHGKSVAETLTAIIREEPEPLERAAPTVPEPVLLILERCLSKEPGGRYESTRDLARELGTWKEHGSSGSASGTRIRSSPAQPAVRRRIVFAAVAAALVLAAAAGVWLWKMRGRGPAVAAAALSGANPPASSGVEPKRVVVAVFENRTGDPSLDPIGRMASDLITDGLSRAGIEVVPSSYAAEVAKPLPEDAAKSQRRDPGLALAEATGSGILVSGEYYLKGSTLQLGAKITDTASRKLLLAVETAEAPRASPSGAVETVRRRVRESLAARLLGSEALSRVASSYEGRPPRYEAYAEMLLGEEAGARGEMEKAWAHERRAIELDPDFVQPYVFLIDDPVSKGDYPEAFRLLGLAQERRGRLSPLGRLDLDASAASVSHRHEEAVIAERELVRLAPGDLLAKFVLAQYLMTANRPREAVQVLTQPARWESFLRPTSPARGAIYFGVLTNALAVLGEHERRLAEARRARGIYTDIGPIRAMEASALAALGRFAEVETAVQESLSQPLRLGWAGRIMLMAAAELRASGHRKESVGMARRAVAWIRALPDENDPRRKGDVLADCLFYAEEWDESAKLHARLATENAGKPGEIEFRGMLGVLAAIQGDREKAHKISEELARLRKPYLFGEDTFQRALIAAQLGEKERAVELLRSAISEGLEVGETYPRAFQQAPSLDSLRGYPPFDELMKPKG